MTRIEVREQEREIVGPTLAGRGIPRRDFLRALTAAGAGAALAGVFGPAGRAAARPAVSFPEGVSSGDPQPDGAVLWTRISAPADGRSVGVVWLVYEDESQTQVVAGGTALARPEAGYSLKVRVRGLLPDRWYAYRFFGPGASSVVGRMRTAPRLGASPDRLRYAFASCQQRTDSYYVAHQRIAEEGVDFLMHLGDYIYVSDHGDLTLDDYRRRWRIFHSHPLLQDLRARVPLVAMWDDGEFYNGVDRTGPPARLAAARQAWFENMPVERGPGDRVYRSFGWGQLADVFMIDVRSYRDPEVPANQPNVIASLSGLNTCRAGGNEIFEPGRTTLGAEQKRWLEHGLRRSLARWRFIGNPYNISPWKLVDVTGRNCVYDPATQPEPGIYTDNEAWDDYNRERRELLLYLGRNGIDNVVFTSGHTHFYFASELQPDYDTPGSPTVAFDFVTGSLTADPDPRTIAPVDQLRVGEFILLENNQPYMKLIDLVEQGYAIVDATPEETIVEFRGIDTFDANAEARTFARFRVTNGDPTLEVL